MKKVIAGLLAALALLSFAGWESSYRDPDCCKETKSRQEDYYETTEVYPTFGSDIPDCCGE